MTYYNEQDMTYQKQQYIKTMQSLKALLLFTFSLIFQMSSSSDFIVKNSEIRIYKNGTIQRFNNPEYMPPEYRVVVKDVKIPPNNVVSARLFKPSYANQKLPFLIYIHGGGFCFGSAFTVPTYSYLNYLVAGANVVAASIEYRLAPEHPIPTCYDDAWAALQWFISTNDEPWLRDYVNFSKIFLLGDSAGANIAHNTLARASLGSNRFSEKGARIAGMALVHPFFGGSKITDAENVWFYFSPNNSGLNDSRLNPAVHPELLKNLICNKILVCIAEKDNFRDRGWNYYQAIKKSDWAGQIQIYETRGEGHEFHSHNLTSEKAVKLMKKMINFFKSRL